MKPYLQDADLTLYHGDVLTTLRELPAESVDCVVTSPPYWGLRDYGTASWEGGDPACEHSVGNQVEDAKAVGAITGGQRPGVDASRCRLCGAHRIDNQLGLEQTPEEYVAKMVEVFREVRRVLAPHGTVWLNLGDSYATDHAQRRSQVDDLGRSLNTGIHAKVEGSKAGELRGTPPGLKPKDLVGIPWRVAFALQVDGWYLRADIIWSKENPMPESITDRPTKAHEYIFLLSKQPKYFFDQEAVREPFSEKWKKTWEKHPKNELQANSDSPYRQAGNTRGGGVGYPDAEGRNIRTVWHLTSQPFAGAHFAVFPEELVRRALLAGCPEKVCEECGRPSERIVEKEKTFESGSGQAGNLPTGKQDLSQADTNSTPDIRMGPTVRTRTVGWTDCGHGTVRCMCCNTSIPHATQRSRETARIPQKVVPRARQGEEQEIPTSRMSGMQQDLLRSEVTDDVQQEVRSTASGEGGEAALVREKVGEIHEQSGIRAAVYARASDGGREREEMGSRTSPGDVGVDGEISIETRARSSQERDQRRQQDRKSGDSDHLYSPRTGRVPPLPSHIQPQVGLCPECGSDAFVYEETHYRPGVVLDPFGGSGTTASVARKHNRHSVLIELNGDYCEIISRRLAQQSLFA